MKLFNFNCTQQNISDSIINGCNIGLMDPNNTKYSTFYNIYQTQISCNWVKEEVDTTVDKKDYEMLNSYERNAYSKVLSQLIFMDSIQTSNTSGNVIPFITEPIIVASLTRQAYEESLHSDSYYKMADSIYEEPDKIYNMWKDDELLKEKNTYIGKVYENFSSRAIENDDSFSFRLGILWEYFKNNKLEKGIEILVNNYIKILEISSKLENKKLTFNENDKKEEIIQSLKTDFFKKLLKNISLKNLSNLHIDFLKNNLIMLEQEKEIIVNYQSLKEYTKKELYERFRARVLMIVANQALEGIYFYSGFLLIYLFGRMGKMLGSTTMIRFIHRDELNHTRLFSEIFKVIHKENIALFNIDLYKECVDILKNAALLEIKWGKYITQNKIHGITNEQIEKYIQFLANDRFKKLGLSKIENLEYPFPNGPFKNPLSWVNKFSKLEDTKTNFFEGDNKNYDNSGLDSSKFNYNPKLFQDLLKKG